MKKLVSSLSFLLLTCAAGALPVGNPLEIRSVLEEPCESECRAFARYSIGYYGDFVFDRHLKTLPGRDIDTTQLITNAAYVAVHFCDRVTLFAALGATRLSINTTLVAFNAQDPHPLFELRSATAFSYSLGGRAILYSYKCAFLGVSGQYFSTQPNTKRLSIASGATAYPDEHLKTHYNEWQLAATLSYMYNERCIPYAAVKYARAFWRLNNGNRVIIDTNTGTLLFNLKNHRHWGYAVGVTLYPLSCNLFNVSAEIRFLDERACYLNIQTQF